MKNNRHCLCCSLQKEKKVREGRVVWGLNDVISRGKKRPYLLNYIRKKSEDNMALFTVLHKED